MIKKGLLIIIASAITILGISQNSKNDNFALLSFVKKDTILLRWAPMNSSLLKRGLNYGFTIERIDLSRGNDFANNSSLKKFEIKPFDSRIVSTNKNTTEYKLMINEYINSNSLKPSEENYTFGLLLLASGNNKELSKILNLRFEDSEVKNNTDYKYRISLKHKYPKSISLKVNSSQLSKNKKLTKLEGKADQKRKKADLKWEVESLQQDYSAYWIERSEDSINFKRIIETPYVFFKSSDEKDKTDIDFVDKTVKEGQTYWYRVVGINHFAETGGISNTVKISIKYILKGIIKIDTIYANKYERIVKGIYETTSKLDSKKLKSFVLLKSKEMHENFIVIANKEANSTSFEFSVNSLLTSGDRNYYKVGAISVDNDTSYSFTKYFFTLDQIPPSQPEELSGIVDSNGVVSLNWKLNPEDDIQGYRVFKSNSMIEEFVEITEFFADTNFYYDTIPLNNLTSTIYYRISAVDLNYNNSIHSKTVKLKKPDTIAPVPCLFKKYNSKENGMYLTWINSTSLDVKENSLIARDSKGREYQVMKWIDSINFATDSTALLGKKTTYYIKTIDESDNEISSNEITVIYETGTRPSVTNLKAEIELENRNINLTWKPVIGKIYSYKIYRAKNENPYRLLKTTRDSTIENYTDKNISINNTYFYKIKVVYQSGLNSGYSDEIKVVY